MRRGYLWLDWVTLGCRGWEIDQSGAGLDQDWQPERCCESDAAHLDRTTLHLMLLGCPAFVRRVMDDLDAATPQPTRVLTDYRIELPFVLPAPDLLNGASCTGTTTVGPTRVVWGQAA